MRIAAWNLNHRTKEKAIPLTALHGIKSVNADILVLTEYVDGPSRLEFKSSLADMGYEHISISTRITIHNQVLIASKSEQTTGDITAPDYTDAAKTNFLHCIFPDHGFQVVGVRPPSYKSRSDLTSYWQQLSKIMKDAISRPIIFVGDLNSDPFGKVTPGSTSLRDLMKLGYNIPNPIGPWSYISGNGNSSSRIDHAVASSSFGKCAAHYIYGEESSIFAGVAGKFPVSDHAILVVDCAQPCH